MIKVKILNLQIHYLQIYFYYFSMAASSSTGSGKIPLIVVSDEDTPAGEQGQPIQPPAEPMDVAPAPAGGSGLDEMIHLYENEIARQEQV